MRYKVLYGGRGSGKTESIARSLILIASNPAIWNKSKTKVRILCTREVQNSVRQSVHSTLKDIIMNYGLTSIFEVTDKAIRCIKNGSEFIFTGLSSLTADSIKSISNVDIAWLEESQTLTQYSLDLLLPSIRANDSEVWFSFNPHLKDDPVYKMFITNGHILDNAIIIKMNYTDNPFFPEVLRKEMERARKDPAGHDRFNWIWLGECLEHSLATVFAGKFASYDFTPNESLWSPMFGSDLGFAEDPTTLIKCWAYEDELYVEYELFEKGLEIDRMPAAFDFINPRKPAETRKYIIYMDCARPETISYMKRNGYPRCMPVKKWSGSIFDGIERLRSFSKIIIHPRCINILKEFETYSYKTDHLTGHILPDVEDRNNHGIDALRYAIQPLILGHKFKKIEDREKEPELDSFGRPIRGQRISSAYLSPNSFML